MINNNKDIRVLITVGVLIGIISVISPGAVFDITLAITAAFIIYRFSGPSERGFLIKLLFWGLLARVILLLSVQILLIHNNVWFSRFNAHALYIFPDAGYYTVRSWGIAQNILGVPMSNSLLESTYLDYGYSFYLYIIAFFYYLFGFSPTSVTFLNCLTSVSTGIVYYFVTKEISNEKSARLAAILIVFSPSLMLWSICNLKDPICIFLLGVVLLAFIRFVKSGKFTYLVLLISALFLQFLMRPKFETILYAILSIFFIAYFWSKKKIKMAHFFIFIALFVIFWNVISREFVSLMNVLIRYHLGIVQTGGICYKIYDEWYYHSSVNVNLFNSLDMTMAFLKGWLHFFLEPFPWKIRSVSFLAAIPQMIIWYLLLPVSMLGVSVSMKVDKKITVTLVAFFILIGSIFAMTGGNIGTDFRMRDMLTPIVLSFSAVGLCHFFRLRR
jgi:4-amino-4-deoxy-L-arabinose transferase-like glycosyltransferase